VIIVNPEIVVEILYIFG